MIISEGEDGDSGFEWAFLEEELWSNCRFLNVDDERNLKFKVNETRF